MADDTSDSLTGFSFAQADSAASRPSRLEDEVVALFDQLRAPVLRYLLSLRISCPDAEEIAQEVFLALFQHLRQNKSRTNLQGWIFKVAHNSALRHRQRAQRHSDRFSYSPDISTAADPDPGPEETLAVRQRQQKLLAVVRALSEQDQCCLSLRAEGLRYREISEVLGISLGSVAASLERSLSRLTRAEQV
jgi:RNA polymerase sigma-70 factor (ECF subfamily)